MRRERGVKSDRLGPDRKGQSHSTNNDIEATSSSQVPQNNNARRYRIVQPTEQEYIDIQDLIDTFRIISPQKQ